MISAFECTHTEPFPYGGGVIYRDAPDKSEDQKSNQMGRAPSQVSLNGHLELPSYGSHGQKLDRISRGDNVEQHEVLDMAVNKSFMGPTSATDTGRFNGSPPINLSPNTPWNKANSINPNLSTELSAYTEKINNAKDEHKRPDIDRSRHGEKVGQKTRNNALLEMGVVLGLAMVGFYYL